MAWNRIVTPRELRVAQLQSRPGVSSERQAAITHREVVGTRAEVSDLTRVISPLNFTILAERIARLNSLLNTRGHTDPHTQKEIEERLFDPDLRAHLLSEKSPWGQNLNRVVIFHRHQLLYLLKFALDKCSFTDGLTWEEEASHAFGRALLMVNAILDPEKDEDTPDDNLSYAARFLPYAIFYSDIDQYFQMGRGRHLWVRLQDSEELKATREHIDLNAVFEGQTGVSLRNYITVLVAASVLCLQFDPADLDCTKNLRINTELYLKNSVLSRDLFEKVIANLSLTPRALRQKVQEGARDSEFWDFTVFQRHPLIEYELGVHLWYDPCLIAKIFTEGIYWQIHDSFPTSQQNRFRTYFGHVYSIYVGEILQRTFPQRLASDLWVPRFHYKPDFESRKRDGECCDGILDLGTDLVLMEFKASLLPLRAKYSGDGNRLKEELDQKFNKRGREPKGVQQLASVFNKLLDGKKPNIEDFDLSRYTTVIPVLVVYDIALTAPLIDVYLGEEFQSAVTPLPDWCPKVGRLIVLSTRDIECLEALSKKHDLRDVFGCYQQQASPLLSFYEYLCKRYGGDLVHADTLLAQSVRSQFEETGKLFFGRDIEAPPAAGWIKP